jgi:hypothetical protein
MKVQIINNPFVNIFPFIVLTLEKSDFVFTHIDRDFYHNENDPKKGFISSKQRTLFMELSESAQDYINTLENDEVKMFLFSKFVELLPKTKNISTFYESRAKLEKTLRAKEEEYNTIHQVKVEKHTESAYQKMFDNFVEEMEWEVIRKNRDTNFYNNFKGILGMGAVKEFMGQEDDGDGYHPLMSEDYENLKELDKKIEELTTKYNKIKKVILAKHTQYVKDQTEGWEHLPKQYQDDLEKNSGGGSDLILISID